MVKDCVTRIGESLAETEKKFKSLSEEELRAKPAPGKWSKKEILGHLIDSAANNHARFVRAQFEPEPLVVQKYAQNEWVNLQRYNEIPAKDILNLWKAYNSHIMHIISFIPGEKLSAPVDIGAFKTFSLEWLIEDYVDHMEHHLKSL